MLVVRTVADLEAAIGVELGPTAWLEISQQRIDAFADATDDHQWIHVDPQRAARGPFGTTVAHGYLTLSLIPALLQGLLSYETPGPRINYGLEKVRFPAAVPVGSRVRGRATITSVGALESGTQVRSRVIVELEGSERPACVAEPVTLVTPA